MREGGNKKVLKVISSLISLDTVHMDIDVVCWKIHNANTWNKGASTSQLQNPSSETRFFWLELETPDKNGWTSAA